MVDFQSRDTRRGVSDEDGDDTEEPTDTQEHEDTAVGADAESLTEAEEPSSPEHTGIALFPIGESGGASDDAADAVADVFDATDWRIVERERVPASFDPVQSAVDRVVARRDVEAVVTVGGTGVGSSDVTVEAVEPLFEKRLPGFGELFRISYHERVGPNVVGMRPMAGISDDVPVFCLPGEQESAQFAASEILVETLGEIVAEATE